MRIIGEKQTVDISEVDAVHGAKPEPEERPFHDTIQVAPGQVTLKDGTTIDETKSTTATQSTFVGDVLDAFGKHCANCKHFNHALGQAQLYRIAVKGSPEEQRMVRTLKGQLIESGVVDAQPDFVSAQSVFYDETSEFVAQMGSCLAMERLTEEVELVHPSQNGCPSAWPDGIPIPFLYEARDAEQAKRDHEAREALLSTASRKLL